MKSFYVCFNNFDALCFSTPWLSSVLQQSIDIISYKVQNTRCAAEPLDLNKRNQILKNMYRIANCYTIEGFCYSNGKMIRSIYVYIKFLGVGIANSFVI